MSLLNRAAEFNHLYDSDGRLQGGLSALEELARVIAIGSGDERDPEAMDESNDDVEPALELPIAHAFHDSPSLLDSDEDMSDDDDEPGSSDDDAMEEIAMYDEPSSISGQSIPLDEPPSQRRPVIVPSSPDAAFLPPPSEIAAQGAALSQRVSSFNSDSDRSTVGPRSHGSRRSSRKTTTLPSPLDAPIPVGEKLKQKFLDMNILSTLLVGQCATFLRCTLIHTLARTYSSSFHGITSYIVQSMILCIKF
jgi:serine/threonine-protein phosphatase 6 regulatory subunit 3